MSSSDTGAVDESAAAAAQDNPDPDTGQPEVDDEAFAQPVGQQQQQQQQQEEEEDNMSGQEDQGGAVDEDSEPEPQNTDDVGYSYDTNRQEAGAEYDAEAGGYEDEDEEEEEEDDDNTYYPATGDNNRDAYDSGMTGAASETIRDQLRSLEHQQGAVERRLDEATDPVERKELEETLARIVAIREQTEEALRHEDTLLAQQQDEEDQYADQDASVVTSDTETLEPLPQTADPRDDMFALLPPGLGDETVRKLDRDVKYKEREIQAKGAEIEEHNDRIGIMSEHLKNVQSELSHTQAVVDAKMKEIQTEDHLKLLAERETERVRSDLLKLEARIKAQQDELNSVQNEKYKAKERLEAFRQQMNWNQEELLQWSLAAKQKEEDKEALEKYAKTDNVKIKELTLALEKASNSLTETKAALDKEITETMSMQIELDKTAEEYRNLHEERQKMIRQWDEAKRAMQKRDESIRKAGERLVDLKAQRRELELQIQQQKKFLETEKAHNHDLERKIGVAERVAATRRMALYEAGQGFQGLEDEIFASRNELKQANIDLAQSKQIMKSMQEAIDEKKKECEELDVSMEQMKQELEEEFAKKASLADRAKQMEVLHERATVELKRLQKQTEAVKQEMFRESRRLFDLRQEEAHLIAEISNAQSSSRNLQARIHQLDQRSLKQQEMLYSIEFRVQQMERKLAHAIGKRSVEETMALKKRIEELKAELEHANTEHHVVTQQTKRLANDLSHTERRHEKILQEIANMVEEVKHVDGETKSVEEEIKARKTQKDQLIVRHDVLKLEVKHLRDKLDGLADEVMALEDRRTQLQLAMTEREKEVEALAEVQKAELKAAEEARHNIAMDLKEREIRLEKLKAKYSTIQGKMNNRMSVITGENEEPGADETRTQAFYIIAAAQEREELQQKGDQLNEKIKQAEKEIRLLYKTLNHLGHRNQTYRESFHAADPNGEDAQTKAGLSEQQRHVNDRVFARRSALRELEAEFTEKRTVLDQVNRNIIRLRQEAARTEEAVMQAQQRAEEEERRLRRSEKDTVRAHDAFRHSDVYAREAGSVGDDALEEKQKENNLSSAPVSEAHIELALQRQRNKALLTLLMQVTELPELRDSAVAALSQVGLADAIGAGGQISSRPSTASSVQSIVSDAPSQRGVSRASSRFSTGSQDRQSVPVRSVGLGLGAAPRPPLAQKKGSLRGSTVRRSVAKPS